uniref:DUF5986 family protein n=1 Tax=Candidatus Limivicinus sp. TaxID=3030905 RepID=UPI003FEF3978
MHTNPAYFSPDLIAKIVRCVEDAVGDDIQADVQRNNLQTRNSVPSRIWDLLNTNVIKTLDTEDCTIAKAHRGPWEMLIVFEKTTQCILTFMREKRFAELRNRQHKRVHMHYIDMLTKQFNESLLSDQQQLSFIPHTFSDEDRLADLVQTMLHDLDGEADIVRHHVLVLFETVGYQLTHIRAVMVTPSLDIAQNSEQDWSRYITADESAVVEEVADPSSPGNQPNRGLSLTAKAMERQKSRPKQKELDVAATKES